METTTYQWSGDCVLLEVRLPPGDPLTLVYGGDDQVLTIQQRGRILSRCFRREGEMHKAISEFRNISRQLRQPGEGE
jgi:hypothetical protein